MGPKKGILDARDLARHASNLRRHGSLSDDGAINAENGVHARGS